MLSLQKAGGRLARSWVGQRYGTDDVIETFIIQAGIWAPTNHKLACHAFTMLWRRKKPWSCPLLHSNIRLLSQYLHPQRWMTKCSYGAQEPG